MSNEPRIKDYSNLASYFFEEVTTAARSQNVRVSEQSLAHVIHVLASCADNAGVDKRIRGMNIMDNIPGRHVSYKPVATLLEEASSSTTMAMRRARLVYIGDLSLFISGYCALALTRRMVGVDYYIGMGQKAYGALADDKQFGEGDLYAEMSDNYHQLVSIIQQISDQQHSTDKDILSLCDMWYAGSKFAGMKLKAMGIDTASIAFQSAPHSAPQ